MQPGDGELAVDVDLLLAHGETIGAIATDVEAARDAAETVRLDSGAYGLLCAFVPFALNMLSDDLAAGLRAAAGSLHDTSTRLRTAAHDFADADADASHQFGGRL